MEMHQVRYFLAAASTLNFTRAAQQCNVSQPALTTAIKKLEERLGTPLFHREGRNPALTDFGRRMLPHLQQLLQQADAAEKVAKDFRLLDRVPVRIGVMSTIGPMRFARLLASVHQSCPGIDSSVHHGAPEALAAQLSADELDFVLVNQLDGLGEAYRAEALYTERYVVLLPPEHPLRDRNALTLRDLSDEPYVDRLSCEMREMVMAVCNERGVNLYARFRSEREDWIEAMVMAKVGFAFMPEYSVLHPDSIRRPLVDPVLERTISLLSVPGRRHPPAVSSLLRAVRAHRWS